MTIDLVVPTNADNYPDFFRGTRRKLVDLYGDLDQRGFSVRRSRFAGGATGVFGDNAHPAIMAAIAAASAADGGVVWFPPGDYCVADTVEVAHSRVVLMGAGPKSQLFNLDATGTRPTVAFRGTAAAPIQYCGLVRMGLQTFGFEGLGHVLLDHCIDSEIVACALTRPGGAAVGGITLRNESFANRIVRTKVFDGAGDGVLLEGNANQTKLSGCRLISNRRNGVRFATAGVLVAGVEITGGGCEGAGLEALYVAAGSQVAGLAVTGWYVEHANNTGPAGASMRVPAGVTLFAGAAFHGCTILGSGVAANNYPLWVQGGQSSDSSVWNAWGANSVQDHNTSNRPRIEVGGWDVPGEAIIQTADGVTPLWPAARLVPLTAGAPITETATPTLLDGYGGQEVTLLNTSANTITLQDQGTLAGSNLRLTGATVALGQRDSITLKYSAHVGDWVQVGNLVGVV